MARIPIQIWRATSAPEVLQRKLRVDESRDEEAQIVCLRKSYCPTKDAVRVMFADEWRWAGWVITEVVERRKFWACLLERAYGMLAR